tara:strand:- start:97 stop:321 length:225 start_codon:yes stop_codon:yes gene_type:complete
MPQKKTQINCRISPETYEKLLALANGYKHKDCPTCGKPWELNNNIITDSIPYSVYAGQLLEKAIISAYDEAQKK